MKLHNLLVDVANIKTDVAIDTLTNNSRDIQKNTLFLAFPGAHIDARTFISDAIAKGAAAVLYENKDGFVFEDNKIPCIGITDLKSKQAVIAARFYDFPGKKVPVIGVTGTNGKTSITQFIAQLMMSAAKPAVIGTLGYGFYGDLKKLPNTTPDGLALQKILFELVNAGATHIVMEVSSHGLIEHRVDEIDFETAVFTNLTQDHLDFHGTMEAYRDAKALLFQKPSLKNAVINIDDEAGQFLAKKCSHLNLLTYSGKNSAASICLLDKKYHDSGFDLKIQLREAVIDVHLPLIGEFNIENILAVLAVLMLYQKPSVSERAWNNINKLQPVPGRMQLVKKSGNPSVIIDYAHTPDALEKVLKSIRAHCGGKLFCVFGCGGNRDKTKRPAMGEIAEKYSDFIVITNDNPRDEDPEQIARDITAVLKRSHKIILDRAAAIAFVLKNASKQDWILLAGKGPETEQIIGKKSLPHNDYEAVMKVIAS